MTAGAQQRVPVHLVLDPLRAGVAAEPHVEGAVVDASGRVYGVTGLYVADASILPGPPTGFPHLVAVMMASRIVDGLLALPRHTL